MGRETAGLNIWGLVRYVSFSDNSFMKLTIICNNIGDQVYPDSFWSGVKSTMAARGIPIILSPSFITYRDPSTASTLASKFPSIDGFFNVRFLPLMVRLGDVFLTCVPVA